MKRALVSFMVAVALGAAGCSETAKPVEAKIRSSNEAGHPQEYLLYTHCGIFKTQFEGRTWYADPPLHDGSFNPPAGWENPFAKGAFVVLSPSKAEFRTPTGFIARFSTMPGPDLGPEACD